MATFSNMDEYYKGVQQKDKQEYIHIVYKLCC